MRIGYATTLLLILFTSTLNTYAACLNDSALQTLKKQELQYMLDRIPPAFSDAVAEKKIAFDMQSIDSDACNVQLEVTLPESDVKQGNQLLEADPAKKIILFSQGYALPETPVLRAIFSVHPESLQITHADILQSGALGKLRASVEMLYAMLTQQRAQIPEKAQNTQPWSTTLREQQLSGCRKYGESTPQTSASCECQINRISAIASEQQMRYIAYVDSNPYAQATGASKNYTTLKKQIQSECAQKY